MADEVKASGSKGEETGGEMGEEGPAKASSIQRSPSRGEQSSSQQPHPSTETEPTPAKGLHRYDTLPAHSRTPANRAEGISPDHRRRGYTVSARPPILEPRALSPRSQVFKRNPSNAAPPADDRIGSIPEGGRGSADLGSTGSRRPRRSNTSVGADGFISSGLRPRVGTLNGSRQRRSTLTRRSSIAVAAMTTAREQDAESQAQFSTAGPAPVDTLAANQAYVDPGYSQLNPAYDQPLNVRPVWGLAKPLPRVIRPGMLPSLSELKVDIEAARTAAQDPANADLEQGRIDPSLKLNKISSQLQNARVQRESNLVRTLSQSGASPISGLRRGPSSAAPLRPASEVIEEDDLSLQPVEPNEDQPGPLQEEEAQQSSHSYPEDASSAITEHEHDGDLDGDFIGHEEFPFPGYDEDDEIHNLHTHWSIIRLRFREPLAELLAVTVQLTLGFCADLTVTTSNNRSGNEETTDWAWGLATMVGIYIAGGISGAHLNPAISIMLYIFRGFPLRKVPMYITAQVLGAFLAGLISFGLFQKDIIEYGGTDLAKGGTLVSFITFPRYSWVDASTAFFTEFTATAILAVAVLALGDDTNAPPGAGMSAFILGLVVTVCSMAFGYNTGAAMNPSRDFGPRLAAWAVGYGGEVFRNGYWVYGPWVGTISGAIFGAFLYDAAIFVGGESPVNYPKRRIKRAGHKWKTRWGQRIKGYKQRVNNNRRDGDGFANGEKLANGNKLSA